MARYIFYETIINKPVYRAPTSFSAISPCLNSSSSRALVKNCSRCQQESEQAATIEQELRRQASSWTPTTGLWKRIKTSVELESSTATIAAPRLYQLSWAAAALLVVTLGLVSFTLLESRSQTTPKLVATALVNEFHTFVISHREQELLLQGLGA